MLQGLLVLGGSLFTVRAAADEGVQAPELTYDLRVDLPLVIGGYVTWSTLQALNHQLAARECRWCDDRLNPVDRSVRSALRWSSRRDLALTASDIAGNTLAPAATIGVSAILAANDRRFAAVPVDIIVTAEAVELAGITTQIVKYSVGRMRPDTRALPVGQRPHTGQGNDAYVSFWSGHTSYTFSLATAAGTVAWLRGYSGYAWVWIGGLSVATATSYLRLAADKHYLTDVLASAATASAIGFAVPFFFHHPIRAPIAITPSFYAVRGGAVVTLELF